MIGGCCNDLRNALVSLMGRSPKPGAGSLAFALYAVLSCLLTWPLAAHLGSRIPLDLGDPLLNLWILSWDWHQLTRALAGNLGALRDFWNASIFYPHPLSLAYSEHLVAQAVQALPVFLATRDALLGYNLVFLSTFSLSGLGAFLLVRELTGDSRAAFVGGLLYAFAPYRMTQIGHLQVLSSQWMPFVLFALTRWFEGIAPLDRTTGQSRATPRAPRVLPLAGAVGALLAQNLSCGYYLVFFAPFAAAYGLWEVHRRDLWRDVRTWTWLAVAVFVAVLATAPFVFPYWELRKGGFEPRPLDEIRRYSADVYSYLRPLDDTLWSRWLNGYTKEEAIVFPGLVPLVLGVVAGLGLLRGGWRAAVRSPTAGRWRERLGAACLAVAVVALAFGSWELLAGPTIQRVRAVWFPLALVGNVLAVAGLALAIWLAASARARAAAKAVVVTPAFFFICATALAAWLSFGPNVTTQGYHLTEGSVYTWLYDYLPGFNGLRVAARFAMVVALALSALGGIAAAALLGRWRWRGAAFLAPLSVLFLVEGASLPLLLVPLEWRVYDDSGRTLPVTAKELDPLYKVVSHLPADAVVVEFPVGNTFDDVRAAYFSVRHGHRLVNGYSGELPPSYRRLREILANPTANPDVAWAALRSSGATCVVVHEWAFEGAGGRAVNAWLEAHGARLLVRDGTSSVYVMP